MSNNQEDKSMERKEQIFTDRYGNEYTPRELVMLGEGKREILNSYQGKKAGDWERDGSGIRKDRLSNLYTHIGYVMDEYGGEENFCESDEAILKFFQWFRLTLGILSDEKRK